MWPREATPSHGSKLGGRSGRRTRDINKATHERASGHPHPATPPPPQQPQSRPGHASLQSPPTHPPVAGPNPGLQPLKVPRAAHLSRPLARTARLPAAAAALPATGAALALRRLPPPPPSRPPGRPALPLQDTALTYAAAATTRPGFPRPGRERAKPLAASPPASQPASQPETGTHPRPLARTARAPLVPAARALARALHTPTGGTQWAPNKCWSNSPHTCALEPDRVVTPPAPTPKSEP